MPLGTTEPNTGNVSDADLKKFRKSIKDRKPNTYEEVKGDLMASLSDRNVNSNAMGSKMIRKLEG